MTNLTNEQLVALYQSEVKNSLVANEIVGLLMGRMEGIMVQFSKRYENIPHTDFEHRYSVVLEAFIKVLDTFDVSRGLKLTTACKTYFSQALNRLYRDQTRDMRYDPTAVHGSYEVMQELRKEQEDNQPVDMSQYQMGEFSQVEILDLLDKLKLNDRQLEMCVGFLEGKSQADIAKSMGVKTQTLSWYKSVVREKMEFALNF